MPVYSPGYVPLAITAYDVTSYAVTASIYCQRQDYFFEAWQLQTFDKIMASYKALQAEYEQRMAAAQNLRGIIISGHNPGINRQVEQTELKKLCITMLTQQSYTRFQAMEDHDPEKENGQEQDEPVDAVPAAWPEVNIGEAIDDGKFIQFFEQAFEWSQMTYLFYPYFWGRKSKWIETSNIFDDDLLFTQFLQAGAVRVVVPVPLAYVDAVLFYLEDPSHPLWGGGGTPRLCDPLYVSLADELRGMTDDLEGAKPEGTSWPIVLPTTLVWLQPGPELPQFP